LFGVSERKGALGSSTYVRVIADEGTTYLLGTHRFVNTNGIVFEMENDFTVGVNGFGYIKVRSVDSGNKTNVEAASIVNVTPRPEGHVAVTNEYQAIGGRDEESDEVLRLRIKNNLNILSISTVEYFTQVFQNIDDRVLRIVNVGTNDDGKRELRVLSQNGIDFIQSELQNMLDQSKNFFPLTDKNRFGDLIGIELKNIEWYYIGGEQGVDFRVQVEDNYSVDEVRKKIQVNLSKYSDFRFWSIEDTIQWDDMLEIVKETEGVKYVPDKFFNPNNDEAVPLNKFPRIRSFIMRDLDGNILYDSNNVLTPVFYPAE
jgi:hypothetical protein